MKVLEKFLATTVDALLRIMLGVYFRRRELFPVLFASNHPASLTDAFIIGTSVARQVHFVATVQLFRFKPLGWLLSLPHSPYPSIEGESNKPKPRTCSTASSAMLHPSCGS